MSPTCAQIQQKVQLFGNSICAERVPPGSGFDFLMSSLLEERAEQRGLGRLNRPPSLGR
jgi:hypothetical protein